MKQALKCQCGHHSSMHPFGHSENLSFVGRCMLCGCQEFVGVKAESVRRQWEGDAMQIVGAVKRDLVPSLNADDGGQLLVWILDLVEKVAASSSPTKEHAE